MKTKRFLSILLSLVLVLGMLPGMSLTASAAGGTTITSPGTTGTMTITLRIGNTVTYIDSTGTNETREFGPYEAGYEYKIEGGSIFPKVPQGKEFDGWKDSNGTPYTENTIVKLNSALTLYAQWKTKSDGDGGEKKTSGGGSGFDLVFNIPGEDNSWGYGGGYAPQRAYRVSLAPMQGGSAALGLTTGESTETAMNVYPTTTVYVFPNAEQGYVLDKIVWSLIDGSASYDITEAKNFVMPAMDVVVYVTFKPAA